MLCEPGEEIYLVVGNDIEVCSTDDISLKIRIALGELVDTFLCMDVAPTVEVVPACTLSAKFNKTVMTDLVFKSLVVVECRYV